MPFVPGFPERRQGGCWSFAPHLAARMTVSKMISPGGRSRKTMMFNVGDMVKLKSGGPDMTGVKIGTAGGEPMVWCAWFEGSKDVYGLFPPNALKATLEPPEPFKGPSEPADTLTQRSEPEETVKAFPETHPNVATEVNSEPVTPDAAQATQDPHPEQPDSAHPAKENDKSLEAQIASVQAL